MYVSVSETIAHDDHDIPDASGTGKTISAFCSTSYCKCPRLSTSARSASMHSLHFLDIIVIRSI